MPNKILRQDVCRADNPLAPLRAPLAPPIPHAGGRESVGLVLVLHGYTDDDARAVARAAALMVHVVVVQNRIEDVRRTQWDASSYRLPVIGLSDPSFSCACATGAARLMSYADPPRWLLFSQADAVYGPDAIHDAIAMSRAHQSDAPYPPAVGPSGGYLHPWPAPGELRLMEYGRQGREAAPPDVEPVDWLAGYWLLVDAGAYRASGGWDPEYALYYEDTDLALRLASVGCRSIVAPGLAVEHGRSVTARREFGDARALLQEQSRARFLRLWAARCVEG